MEGYYIVRNEDIHIQYDENGFFRQRCWQAVMTEASEIINVF